MENSDSAPSPSSLAAIKENATPTTPKIAELAESRQELLGRIQNLKQDLQSWRTKMDTQVKVYHNELSELKKSLNTEVEQLRTEFKELRSTLQQQQEDVTCSLKSLGLQDDTLKPRKGERPNNDESGRQIAARDSEKDADASKEN